MRALVLLAALAACQPANAGTLRFDGPVGTLAETAPGDSLRYTVTGPAVPGASSYVWTVTAGLGVWTNLPAGQATTNPVLAFTAVAPVAWDSVTFTVTFQGKSASRSSNILTTNWKVRRSLLATGPLIVDSSAVGPISLEVRPSAAVIAAGGTVQLCAFWRFGSGHVVMRSQDVPTCGPAYTANFTLTQRSVTAPEQGWLDLLCDWPTCLLGQNHRAPADVLYVRRL
jgi:hypothetical protein